MSDLGALLKKAREQRGYSLDDIQETTKIRKRYLEAIEEGNYKVLPGSFYVRAFVKNYAETVGLDSEEVLRLYNKEIPSLPTEPASEPMVKSRRASARVSDRWSKWGFTLLLWSFLILIGVIIYTYAINKPDDPNNKQADSNTPFTNDSTPPPTNSGNANAEPDPEPETEIEPDLEPEIPAINASLVKTEGNTDFIELSTPGPHTYEITVEGGSSWLEVYSGSSKGERLHFKTENSGAVLSFTIEGGAYMNVGRADLVEIKVDGLLIDDQNLKGKSRRFQFIAANSAAD